ncbi:protein FAM83G [Hippocampus zosterae]|uniref:protein FAM83G n=1 Tax=Hippocampus zosterae TaxID=109293 RepID=UPI00223CE282|nr:protein FAM83G [Hippocampus zosterae]XP_051941116.1 protein FAM83G [Hippocampus zosterae]XP_051941117.1 protein FAM83G [Hippocampus zosterae]
MALSQIQCLDDHHVNWRVCEGKPEFFYSENQRLALEKLITQGRGAFTDYLRENEVRDFLSETELERIAHTAELYRPGQEHHQKPDTPGGHAGNTTPGSGEDGALDGQVSLQYWPDRSEASVAELDLGWPEAISYRGVTRVSVYTQPPTDGQAHIKEVVRKSIASAQKVIAVVMDAFTDVDIFRDLLDAAYRRKVPVYIIIDMAAVPSFLSMCGRADMHRGHLKNLRVRCCGGVEFFTRSAQKVRGSLSQRFLLVDGDRAISGSYSFTWASSRLDRNLITVITGQAMETFDFQFRELFLLSRSVSLSKVPMVDEPIPDPLPQAAPVVVPASVAKKLINPKYALVATGTHTSPTSSDQNSSNKNSRVPAGLKIHKGRLKDVSEEPQIHPALVNMEKAYLIPYLPTWPEPDPPSDVIGFINIRDEKRANQVHLQRSERFAVSQAIRFSSSLTLPSPTEESGKDTKDDAQPGTGNTSAAKGPQQEVATPYKDSADAADSKAPPQQQPDSLLKQETQQTPSAAPQPSDTSGETPETPAVAPPVPKRRTLHLVIDPTPSDQPIETQVTLVKIDNMEMTSNNNNTPAGLGHVNSKEEGGDSGSNDNGSQDSTKVMCDRAGADVPSSASTASEEEFFDCSQQQPADPLADRVSTGSGRGHRLMDGVNMMARLSQSMLDLRDPPSQKEDSAALIRQSQQLRRRGHGSPHRRLGQLFQLSRSPGRDGRLRGTKVVIAKPGSFHRPQRATGPVIGGHRYWHGHTLQPDAALTRAETRSSRSARRHSPGDRKGANTSSPLPAANSSGGIAPLSNLRHSKVRGGALQKKVSQNNNRASR